MEMNVGNNRKTRLERIEDYQEKIKKLRKIEEQELKRNINANFHFLEKYPKIIEKLSKIRKEKATREEFENKFVEFLEKFTNSIVNEKNLKDEGNA